MNYRTPGRSPGFLALAGVAMLCLAGCSTTPESAQAQKPQRSGWDSWQLRR